MARGRVGRRTRGRTSPPWWSLLTARQGRGRRVDRRRLAVIGLAAVGSAAAVRAVGKADNRRLVEHAITVGRPVEEVYGFWRDFANLPRFMPHLERVEVLDERRSRWVAAAPAGQTVAWRAEIEAEEPNRLIAWRALAATAVPHEGRVSFTPAPGGRGTEVRVQLSYRPPAGVLGVVLARLAGEEPSQQVRDALRRLKQVLECGQVIGVDEQVSGRSPTQRRLTGLVRRRLATGGRP
jgi:uncharacterized membrane protein